MCVLFGYPPPPWISATHHYHQGQWVVSTPLPGPGNGGGSLWAPGSSDVIITGYSHNQPQLAFLSLSLQTLCYYTGLKLVMLTQYNWFDYKSNKLCHHQCRCDTHLVSSFPSLEIISLVIIMLMREAQTWPVWCDSPSQLSWTDTDLIRYCKQETVSTTVRLHWG